MNAVRAASLDPFTGRVVLAVILVLIALFSHVLRLRKNRHASASLLPPA